MPFQAFSISLPFLTSMLGSKHCRNIFFFLKRRGYFSARYLHLLHVHIVFWKDWFHCEKSVDSQYSPAILLSGARNPVLYILWRTSGNADHGLSNIIMTTSTSLHTLTIRHYPYAYSSNSLLYKTPLLSAFNTISAITDL